MQWTMKIAVRRAGLHILYEDLGERLTPPFWKSRGFRFAVYGEKPSPHDVDPTTSSKVIVQSSQYLLFRPRCALLDAWKALPTAVVEWHCLKLQ